MIRIRRGAYKEYPIGTIFKESDGPYIVVKVNYFAEKRSDGEVYDIGYDYHLQKMTPEEIIVYDVIHRVTIGML